MKKVTVYLFLVVVLLFIAGTANAALTTIGTATYNGGDFNLIYEDDSIDGGLVWLDYSRGGNEWQNQVNWASGLNTVGVLTYNLNSGVSVTWGGDFRLPTTDESQCNLTPEVGAEVGYEGPDENGYHDYREGSNMVNSEMGHLYYESLGNLGAVATDGTNPQPNYGLINTGDFNNLMHDFYWSGTNCSPFPDGGWYFNFRYGAQGILTRNNDFCALAVRSAQVSVVPIPSAIWLLGSGLIGLVGFRRKIRKA